MTSLQTVEQKSKSSLVSVQEYRKILNDEISSESQILERLNYLEALCRNVAKSEIETYVNEAKNRARHQN